MANLGNAWHIPANPEPRGHAGMRDPVGAIVPGTAVTILTGNQFQGGGNPGNQLQVGSSMSFKRQADANWTQLPLTFQNQTGNNKYYEATIPAHTFQAGDAVQYYLRIAYNDHETTFLLASGAASAVTADEAQAQANPFTFIVESSAVKGEWGPVVELPNVAIHAHVLPNGEVLMWGRRSGTDPNESLDEHFCTPFVWDPATGATRDTPQPKLADGTTVNLFCSGHTFLPDGRLLVAGGHLSDSQGVNQAAVYDPANDTWRPTDLMNAGRWYPTATSLPDGTVLVLSGSITPGVANFVPQVWSNGHWLQIGGFPIQKAAAFPLFPRMHVASNGLVFMSGSETMTWFLNISNGGQWTQVAPRDNAQRDYAPSVMYDVDKVIYIGGGNDQPTLAPTANAEIIDLSEKAPQWQPAAAMHFPRRQHNGTILPDGTVLVTGGTRGGDGPNPGFNDLTPGQPVHIAELWDPESDAWTELSAELIDRCYHSTAVLLLDATVLSAGGGEFRPIEGQDIPNDAEDTHRDAQIFSPPYLFKGARPQITSAPASVGYGAIFEVGTPQASEIRRVTLIRLSSVTHSFNMNQHINFPQFAVGGAGLKVTAPPSPNVCPPGHYMLFILNTQGVPSVAKVIQVTAGAGMARAAAARVQAEVFSASRDASDRGHFPDAFERRDEVLKAAHGTSVVLGISGTCPYGIGACWGGAHEALLTLEGVQGVDPIPDAEASTARLFLEDDGLPALARWQDQFHRMVNGSYVLRGVEVTLEGQLDARNGALFLAGRDPRPPVQLLPLVAADKVQWDRPAGAPQPAEPDEVIAYERLAARAHELPAGQEVTVTGPLKKSDTGYLLEVRTFAL
jgi:galactose oxidase